MIAMGQTFKFISCLIILSFAAGCIHFGKKEEISISRQLGSYSGRKAKIAVSDFEIKTSGIDQETADSLREAFVNILGQSNRFILVPQQEAELAVNISILEFNPEAAGGKSGLAGGGSAGNNFMGGLLGASLNNANMGLSLRVIERLSATVIDQKVIRVQAAQPADKRKKSTSGIFLKENLTVYAGAPMGQVIRDCLLESARYLAQGVEPKYYKY